MYRGSTILGVVAARGGSRGLPRKNVLDIAGRPLVAWSVRAGAESELLDRCILSSDDEEIIAAARAHGADVPFVRPIELATDTATAAPVVLHALEAVGAHDYVVLLQATSPLRTGEHIDACIRQCIDRGAPACVSVTPAAKSPYWMYRIESDVLEPLFPELARVGRRQELPEVYALNGAIYVIRAEVLERTRVFTPPGTVGYVMGAECSVDIDSSLDAALATLLLESRPG